MTPRKARQAFDTNTVEKHDNTKTLLRQRKEARDELERIITWAEHSGRLSIGLKMRLDYLRDKILREDV